MQTILKFFIFFLSILGFGILSGCSSKPSSFYLLNPIHTSTSTISGTKHTIIGISGIKLAQYLQQPQIISRNTANELNLAEFHRWAEPLKDNIQSVIVNNLRGLLKQSIIINHPWNTYIKPNFTIQVIIGRFDISAHGIAILNASIIVRNQNNTIIKAIYNKRFNAKVASKNYNAMVMAMNRNLSNLSRFIARIY